MTAAFDRIDRQLISLLQNNARLSNKQLAAEVGLAPSTCHERLKRLWENGVLRGTHTDVDPGTLGLHLQALLMIGLKKHERDTVEKFLDHAQSIPAVQSAYLITGTYDIVLHVVARDTTQLKNLALDHFNGRVGVARIETSIIYDARHCPGLPLTLDDSGAGPGC